MLRSQRSSTNVCVDIATLKTQSTKIKILTPLFWTTNCHFNNLASDETTTNINARASHQSHATKLVQSIVHNSNEHLHKDENEIHAHCDLGHQQTRTCCSHETLTNTRAISYHKLWHHLMKHKTHVPKHASCFLWFWNFLIFLFFFVFEQKFWNSNTLHATAKIRNVFQHVDRKKTPFDETQNPCPKHASCFFWFLNFLIYCFFVFDQKFWNSNTLHAAAKIRIVFQHVDRKMTPFDETQNPCHNTFRVVVSGASGVGVGIFLFDKLWSVEGGFRIELFELF